MSIVILGAGLAGMSCGYHLRSAAYALYEKKSYYGGHTASHKIDECYWDEGPHISFTKHEYVKNIFDDTCGSDIIEQANIVANWYQGSWIPHPAQSNLYAVPQPLASLCLKDFLESVPSENSPTQDPANYAQWLDQAFGSTFASSFPYPYTRKYWTCAPDNLTVDWVGERVFRPDVKTVVDGFSKPAAVNNHYFSTFRYPLTGGFASFLRGFPDFNKLKLDHDVLSVDLEKRLVHFTNGQSARYDRLINTLPLPVFVSKCAQCPEHIKAAADLLVCSSVLLVNIKANGPSLRDYHWMYVYDEELLSTRITQIHRLSEYNCPVNTVGIQIEVYESKYRPFSLSHDEIKDQVLDEAVQMGLINGLDSVLSVHLQYIPFANVIFDHNRRQAQDAIYSWLENYGLMREADDLSPMTDWSHPPALRTDGLIYNAGRYGQWKYFWTDDCVMRGAQLAKAIIPSH
jgi:protoporphyrinogen oxidase